MLEFRFARLCALVLLMALSSPWASAGSVAESYSLHFLFLPSPKYSQHRQNNFLTVLVHLLYEFYQDFLQKNCQASSVCLYYDTRRVGLSFKGLETL